MCAVSGANSAQSDVECRREERGGNASERVRVRESERPVDRSNGDNSRGHSVSRGQEGQRGHERWN
jgi:hypothetical protein